MNNLLEYKGYYGTVEFSSSDNILFGKIIGIAGLISYEGDNIDNLRKDFESAIDDYLDICAEEDITPQRSYKGKFNVRISPELHQSLVLYSASHGRTLNSTVEEAIKKYVT